VQTIEVFKASNPSAQAIVTGGHDTKPVGSASRLLRSSDLGEKPAHGTFATSDLFCHGSVSSAFPPDAVSVIVEVCSVQD
jgi:hypothetical protein